MKATTHEVVQEDRSLIMPVFPFPHLQCKTRTEKALKSELSFMTLTTEVILQEGFVPRASRFAVCNCEVSINSNQESFPPLGSDEGEPQGRSFTQPTLPPKGISTARVNGPTLQPRKQQLFLLPDNHQRPWVRDFLLSWSSALSPPPWMPLFSSDRCSGPGLSFPKEPCSVLGSNPAFDTEDNIYCSGRKLIFFFNSYLDWPSWV